MQVERCFRGAGQKEKRLLAKGSLSRPAEKLQGALAFTNTNKAFLPLPMVELFSIPPFAGNSWEQSGERVRNAWESAEQFGPNPEES